MVLASEQDLGIHACYYGFRLKGVDHNIASLILPSVDNNILLVHLLAISIMHIVHFYMHELSFTVYWLTLCSDLMMHEV